MQNFKLTFFTLLAATLACGDSSGATTASGTGSTDAGSTDATTSGPSTGSTTSPATSDATDGSATSDATSSTTTGDTSGDPSTATTEDTTTTTGTTTTGTTTTGTTGDTTGDGTSPLVIAIVDAELWADCMPLVPPDPVQGSWYVEFDNTNNPADTEAVVTGAWLSLAGGEPKSEPILVEPAASGPLMAGEYVSLKLQKLPSRAHGACGHCGEFYDLVLEYDEGGIIHEVQEAVTISCAF